MAADNCAAGSVRVAWGGAGLLPPSVAPSAWGPTHTNIPTHSFRDLQSEDLAKKLNEQEAQKFQQLKEK